MDYAAVKTGLDFISIILALGAWLYTWATNRDRARHAEVAALQEKIADEQERRREECKDLRDRMAHAEARLDEAPTGKALHEVALSIAGLSGDLKATVAELKGMGHIVTRLDASLQRQEEWLMKNAGGK